MNPEKIKKSLQYKSFQGLPGNQISHWQNTDETGSTIHILLLGSQALEMKEQFHYPWWISLSNPYGPHFWFQFWVGDGE